MMNSKAMLHELDKDKTLLTVVAENVKKLEDAVRRYSLSANAEDYVSVIIYLEEMKILNQAIIETMQSVYARRQASTKVLEQEYINCLTDK